MSGTPGPRYARLKSRFGAWVRSDLQNTVMPRIASILVQYSVPECGMRSRAVQLAMKQLETLMRPSSIRLLAASNVRYLPKRGPGTHVLLSYARLWDASCA